MSKEINYVVTAYKWGFNDTHSYILGVFSKKDKAIEVADSHRDYRGGKYSCVVDECIVNEFENEFPSFTTIKQISLTEDLFPEESEKLTKNEEENEEDELMKNMTIRDFAAIMWNSPISNKQWLNKLIKN